MSTTSQRVVRFILGAPSVRCFMRSHIVALLLLVVGCSSRPSTAPTGPAVALRDAVLAHLPTGPYQTTVSPVMGRPITVTHHTDPARARMLVAIQFLPGVMSTTARYDGKRVVTVTNVGGQTVAMTASQQALGEPFAWGLSIDGAMIDGCDLVHVLRSLLQSGQPVLGTPSTVDNEALQTLRIVPNPEQVFAWMVKEHSQRLVGLAALNGERMQELTKELAAPSVLSIDASFHIRRIQNDVNDSVIELAPLTPANGPSDADLITPAEDMQTIMDVDARLQEQRRKVDALLADQDRLQALRSAFLAAWPKHTP
jgi:hypothetical protein